MSNSKDEGMTRVDILIVGAGPAGCAAAIHAHSAGFSVQIVDQANFPRDKTCGDGLTTLALQELAAIGFQPSLVTSWRKIDRLQVTSPSGRLVSMNLPDDGSSYVAIAPRFEFDDVLLHLARERGVDVREGHAVVDIVSTSDGWVVTLDDGVTMEATYLLHCGGARGLRTLKSTAYQRGTRHRDQVIASRAYLEGTGRLPDVVHLWFWDEVLPGYAWMFPVGDDSANVGVVIHTADRKPSDIVHTTELLLDSDWLLEIVGGSARRSGALRTWPIPSEMSRSPTADGVFRLGDAAGLADPMTGEGIAQALVSARLAIASIKQHPDRPDKAARRYRKALAREFLADQRTSRILLVALRKERLARAAVRFMGLSGGLSDWFARWTFEDVPRRAVLSPWTLVRNLGPPTGADFRGGPTPDGHWDDSASATRDPESHGPVKR